MRGMNKLPSDKRVQILQMLCEGSSMRSISRVADVSINTVAKLLVDAGKACAAFHDEKVRGVTASRVQCDEIWSFTYAKQKNVAAAKAAPEEAGDTWTWTAIDAQSKLRYSSYSAGLTQFGSLASVGAAVDVVANGSGVGVSVGVGVAVDESSTLDEAATSV